MIESTSETHADPVDARPDPNPPKLHRTSRIVILLAFISSLVTWYMTTRAVGSDQRRLKNQAQALTLMRQDAQKIQRLSTVPHRATDRKQIHDALLASIETALFDADLQTDVWRDSVPQAPKRVPNTSYLQITTVIYLEAIELKPLIRFVHSLVADDSTIELTSMRLTSARSQVTSRDSHWNVELALTYLVYTPIAQR